MASNGYVRRNCHDCIFYEQINDMGASLNLCNFNKSQEIMKSITAYEYDRNPEMKQKYDEPCEHHINREQIRKFYKKIIEICFKEEK